MQSNTVYSSELQLHKSANNFYTCKSREKNDERSGKSIVVFVEAAGPRSSEKKREKCWDNSAKKDVQIALQEGTHKQLNLPASKALFRAVFGLGTRESYLLINILELYVIKKTMQTSADPVNGKWALKLEFNNIILHDLMLSLAELFYI